MIPMEVGEIATILRNHFDVEYNESIQIAYEIYNQLNICECA